MRPRHVPPGPRRLRVYRLVCGLIDLAVGLVVRRVEYPRRLPDGPLLVTPNHLSVLDPLLVAGFLQRCGRTPRFVTTSGVFEVALVGDVLRYFDHLPLTRKGPASVVEAQVQAAAAHLRRGECVVLYPEGRVTPRDDFLPATGMPGVPRIAALSGARVVTVGHWGSQQLTGRGRRFLTGGLPRRPRSRIALGEVVHVAPGTSGRDLVRATKDVMDAIGTVVSRLADEAAADPRSDAR
jgi:1-acyl-sn-glycerol-3-phosphate acyltransferase